MKKDKLGAFIDAVYAITITICIINLEKPASVSWEAFWAIKDSFIVYTITFFMMVSMWVQIHYLWDQIERIDNAVIWSSMLFLFTSSFIPYMTSLLVSDNFSNNYFAVSYGVLSIFISLNLLIIQKTAENCNTEILNAKFHKSLIMPNERIMIVDIAIKVLGTILSIFIWPPTILIAVLVSFEYNSIATRVVIRRIKDETLFDRKKRIELKRKRVQAIKDRIEQRKQERINKKLEKTRLVVRYINNNTQQTNTAKTPTSSSRARQVSETIKRMNERKNKK